MEPSKSQILTALRAFVNQRPGFNWHDYGDAASYRGDLRTATRQRRDALELLRWIEWHGSITGAHILAACTAGGRLSVTVEYEPVPASPGLAAIERRPVVRVDYCTGQYWCTEFRGAVARFAASVIWDWYRDGMPDGSTQGAADGAALWYPHPTRCGGPRVSAGDWMRATLRREFGPGLARRYFS